MRASPLLALHLHLYFILMHVLVIFFVFVLHHYNACSAHTRADSGLSCRLYGNADVDKTISVALATCTYACFWCAAVHTRADSGPPCLVLARSMLAVQLV
jgi:hypothetical protein